MTKAPWASTEGHSSAFADAFSAAQLLAMQPAALAFHPKYFTRARCLSAATVNLAIAPPEHCASQRHREGCKRWLRGLPALAEQVSPSPAHSWLLPGRTQREDEAVLHHTWALLAEKVLVTSVTPECQGIISYFHSIVQSSHT